jgi:hypothetical protein
MESSMTYTGLLKTGVLFEELTHKYTICNNVIGSIVFAMSTHTSRRVLNSLMSL